MDEIALVDRVFMRIVSTESDDSLQAALHKFLAPVLLKLASPSEEVRKKVMELLVHVNKRLKSRPKITLPITQLLAQFSDASNSTMVTNFSLVYIKLGLPRTTVDEQVEVVPSILKFLHTKPLSQQEMFMNLILPAMQYIKFPSDPAKRQELFGLPDQPAVRAVLLRYMFDILLMPFTLPLNTTDDGAVLLVPPCPACFSINSFKKLQGITQTGEYPTVEIVESLKIGVAHYLVADIFPLKEIVLHLIVASADSRHTVAALGETAIRRVSSEVNWEDEEFIKKMTALYLGTVNQISRDRNAPSQSKKDIIQPAPTRMKAMLFPHLLKSKYAAQIFPQNIQIACDALAGPDTRVKIQKYGIQYVANMADHGLVHHLKALAPTLLKCLWTIIDAKPAESELLSPAYSTIGRLASQVPSLLYDNIDIVSTMFTKLAKEDDKAARSSIQSALIMMTPSISKARQDIKDLLVEMLASNIESSDDTVRRASLHIAHHAYHTSWLPTRYLLLLACSDQLPDIQSEARKLLHSKRQVEMPVAEHSFDLDLYPSFEEMSGFIETKRLQRIKEKKTITRGSTVMAFKPGALSEMVRYLRTCLARSCGIKDPNVTDIADWMDQAPIIFSHSRSHQGSEGRMDTTSPPSVKQHKMSTEAKEGEMASQSMVQYSQLLIQNIMIQATAVNVYLLLELLATNSSLARQLSERLEWVKGLVNHHDSLVQSYSAQLLAVIVIEGDMNPVQLLENYIDNFNPKTLSLEQQNGSLYAIASLISYHHRSKGECEQPAEDKWLAPTAKAVRLIERLLHDVPKATVALQVLLQISVSGPLCIDYGSEESMDGEVNVYSIINLLREKAKSAKLDSKQRERVATCLGSIGVGDKNFPHRKLCLDGLFECSTTKELELHFTVGQAIVMSAQGLDCSERRDMWRQSESDYWAKHVISSQYNEVEYLMSCVLDKYICHVNPHVKQAACVWLLTAIKKCSKFPQVIGRSSEAQAAFMSLLTDNDEITQDVASKGLGLVYDNCNETQKKELISNLVGTLMTGKSAVKKSGEVSKETKLFSEGSLGSTPEGQGMNTYRELCAIATDLNQPDLIYKFLHLANHQSMWNSRKGAAFGFSTIAAQAGEQLAPYMSQIVPRLYRYTFDPNMKIQTAMRGIWNAVVTESKSTVDKYMREILDDLLNNLTNNQWRVRESCCLAVNDLIRGRQLDDVLDQLPSLWHVMLKLLDDIKESTRLAATGASNTLSKVTVKICDINYGKSGEKALSLILPVLLTEGITSNVSEVRTLSLDTVVSMSKNAGAFLKPHIHVLVPIMLESLSGLESQSLNYLAVRVSGNEEVEQRLDRARVAASKMSPMMDSINLCIQQVDSTVLSALIPRLTDLIKSSIGLGTKVGISNVITALCVQCGLQTMQPFAGKCMLALWNGLSDRNITVRKTYCTCLATLCKLAKDSSVENLLQKIYTWYMERDDETLHEICGQLLKAMSDHCPDTLNNHKTQVLPLIFLAIHKTKDSIVAGTSTAKPDTDSLWTEIWNEVTIGTDSAVRLYIQEFIAITDVALQSNSWPRKAQAAVAIGTIAKSAGAGVEKSHLSQLVSALLSGLSGRTWPGKESLLTALSDVVRSCSTALISENSSINTDLIVNTCLREARKELPAYKLPALKCLSQVLESLESDRYCDLYEIVEPCVNMDKHEDEEISGQVLINIREAGFEALGKAYHSSRAGDIRNTTKLLLIRLPQVTWKEQLAIWNSFSLIISRGNLKELRSTETTSWSLREFSDQLTELAITSAQESKYSSVREAACTAVKELLEAVKGADVEIPAKILRTRLEQFAVDAAVNDSSLVVKKLCGELQASLQKWD